MTISAEQKRVYASAPSDRRVVETIELNHPLFPETYYLVNDKVAWEFLLTEDAVATTPFDAVGFAIQQPARDGKGQQDLNLVLDNVGREAMDAIEAAAADPATHIGVVYRKYLDVAGTAPSEWPPYTLALQSITVTAEAIVGTATRADVLNLPFPRELYRVDNYPGLNR